MPTAIPPRKAKSKLKIGSQLLAIAERNLLASLTTDSIGHRRRSNRSGGHPRRIPPLPPKQQKRWRTARAQRTNGMPPDHKRRKRFPTIKSQPKPGKETQSPATTKKPKQQTARPIGPCPPGAICPQDGLLIVGRNNIKTTASPASAKDDLWLHVKTPPAPMS